MLKVQFHRGVCIAGKSYGVGEVAFLAEADAKLAIQLGRATECGTPPAAAQEPETATDDSAPVSKKKRGATYHR